MLRTVLVSALALLVTSLTSCEALPEGSGIVLGDGDSNITTSTAVSEPVSLQPSDLGYGHRSGSAFTGSIQLEPATLPEDGCTDSADFRLLRDLPLSFSEADGGASPPPDLGDVGVPNESPNEEAEVEVGLYAREVFTTPEQPDDVPDTYQESWRVFELPPLEDGSDPPASHVDILVAGEEDAVIAAFGDTQICLAVVEADEPRDTRQLPLLQLIHEAIYIRATSGQGSGLYETALGQLTESGTLELEGSPFDIADRSPDDFARLLPLRTYVLANALARVVANDIDDLLDDGSITESDIVSSGFTLDRTFGILGIDPGDIAELTRVLAEDYVAAHDDLEIEQFDSPIQPESIEYRIDQLLFAQDALLANWAYNYGAAEVPRPPASLPGLPSGEIVLGFSMSDQDLLNLPDGQVTLKVVVTDGQGTEAISRFSQDSLLRSAGVVSSPARNKPIHYVFRTAANLQMGVRVTKGSVEGTLFSRCGGRNYLNTVQESAKADGSSSPGKTIGPSGGKSHTLDVTVVGGGSKNTYSIVGRWKLQPKSNPERCGR